MSKKLNRYQNEVIINHLASHYVLGLLSDRVATRVEYLMQNNPQLSAQVNVWQKQLSLFDRHCDEVSPEPEVWQKIQKKLFKSTDKKAIHTKVIVIIILTIIVFISMGLNFA